MFKNSVINMFELQTFREIKTLNVQPSISTTNQLNFNTFSIYIVKCESD